MSKISIVVPPQALRILQSGSIPIGDYATRVPTSWEDKIMGSTETTIVEKPSQKAPKSKKRNKLKKGNL